MENKKLCPVMQLLGFAPESCQCDWPQCRSLISEKEACAQGKECRLRNLIPEQVSPIVQHNEYDRKPIPQKILSELKTSFQKGGLQVCQ